MQDDAAVSAIRGLSRAVYAVAEAVHAPSQEERLGTRSELRPPRAIALALRFCRSVDEEGVWHGLAEHLRRVPDGHVGKARMVGHGPECWAVACACGASALVLGALVECPGSCGRWFAADTSGVWAVRLPEQEAVAA